MANDEQMGAWLTGHSRQPVPLSSPYMVVGLLFFVPISVAPYSIIPSVMNWRFCGVLLNYHFGPREAGKSLMNSSSQDAFNTPNTCCPFVGPVPDEGIASSSVRFSLLYVQCSFFIFPSFHLCWLLRETEREIVALLLRRFSFRQYIFRHLILRLSSGLPSKYLSIVSFHFLAFFFCSQIILLVRPST